MVQGLAAHWWAIALRGAAAVIFGVIALFWPPEAFAVLVVVFGAYALVDGIFNLIAGIRSGIGGERWGALIFEGVVSVIVGLVTLFWPGLTALALVLWIAAWSLVTGIFEIVAAIRLRKQIRGEWLLGLSGVLSIALGVLLFAFPVTGALVIIIWIGAYAVLFGAMLIGLAFKLRPHAQSNVPAKPAQHAV